MTYRFCYVWALVALSACTADPSPESSAALAELLVTPAGEGSAQPHLAQYADTLVLSWQETDDEGVTQLRYAQFESDGWVSRPPVASGRDWFVNWADFPSVVPVSDQLWAAHWLRRTPGGRYSYEVRLTLSRDGGRTWGAPFTAHRDGTATEHGFVSIFPWSQSVGVLWLDGRYTQGHGHGDELPEDSAGDRSGMTLRAARFGASGERLDAMEVDGLVCDCCQTDVVGGAEGPIATYRNRTREEWRDIEVRHFSQGRWPLSTLQPLRPWQVRGCPVNGPAIDAMGERAVVAWYSGADDRATVSVAWSVDAGVTFGPEVVVDDVAPIGRVDVVLLARRGALVSWVRPGDAERGAIAVRYVDEAGRSGPIHSVITTTLGRPSGFPQLARHGEHVVLAWTDVELDRVRSARLALKDLLPPAIPSR